MSDTFFLLSLQTVVSRTLRPGKPRGACSLAPALAGPRARSGGAPPGITRHVGFSHNKEARLSVWPT